MLTERHWLSSAVIRHFHCYSFAHFRTRSISSKSIGRHGNVKWGVCGITARYLWNQAFSLGVILFKTIVLVGKLDWRPGPAPAVRVGRVEFWGAKYHLEILTNVWFSVKDIFKYVIEIYICPTYETNYFSLKILTLPQNVNCFTQPAHSWGRLVTGEKES